jgi:hypothetical protein
VLHIFAQVLFWAGNQDNHQNFNKFVLPNKFGLIFMWMKQKKIFLKKKIQNGQLQKTEFFNSANAQYFFAKFLGIGPWVSKIN